MLPVVPVGPVGPVGPATVLAAPAAPVAPVAPFVPLVPFKPPVTQVPSPRQKVVAEAFVPLFNLLTGRLAESDPADPEMFVWSPVLVPLAVPVPVA